MLHRPVCAVIQARMTSTRLPGKILKKICGKEMLAHQIERLQRVSLLDEIVIATTTNATDDPVVALASQLNVGCHRGSENNVLSRVLGAANLYEAEIVIRSTGDCPLIDPDISNHVIETFLASDADYVSNTLERTYPIGMDIEIISRSALEQAGRFAQKDEELEHVTPYIYRHPEKFRLVNVKASSSQFYPDLRLTLDTPEDLELITKIFEALYPNGPAFTLGDILTYLSAHPELRAINANVPHNWIETL